MNVKIIFDKEAIDDKLSCGWGISYLVNERILFDAGEKSKYLLDNLRVLNVDAAKIKKIVISHKHWNHIGGLWKLLEINKNVEVFVTEDFIEEFKDKVSNYNFKVVEGTRQINKDIYVCGPYEAICKGNKLKEQVLILRSEKGTSIICGCLHSGILEIIKKIKTEFSENKIYSMLGGFHLINKDNRSIKYLVDEIKKQNIENVGPSHCTGFEAVNVFRQAYRGHFLDIKAGSNFQI